MSVADTRVTFASGAVHGTGTVVLVHHDADGAVVVLDETPFHPVDHTWPDQPGDTGILRAGGVEHAVVDTLMAAVDAHGAVAIGTEIPVKRGEDGWTWLVAHRLDRPDAPVELAVGATVDAEVDAARRAALSRGHSACHLAALALNAATTGLWSKDIGLDALGAANFDLRAGQSSRIRPDGSVDEYRLGKSLRRSGFDAASFAADLDAHRDVINAKLREWVASGALSRIETDGPTIVDRRTWHCVLPEGEAAILCGGTHVSSLGEFAEVSVSFAQPDAQTVVMTTTAVPAE
ncbi:alanyl-tRNA editing protein [Microbacterium gorillae]|uniref:hypothetical protein n=1 Tax=Microbacterium gorillae TaxID=1231063 RepID=UPI00058CE1EF|nr:hypothetical protein [Microbacterium gorillae]